MDLNIFKGTPFFLDDVDLEWVTKTYTTLSLEEKIGQLFLPICQMPTPEKMQKLLAFHPGGIHRLAALSTEELCQTATVLQSQSKVPLLLTGDIEFGAFGSFLEGTHYQVQVGTAATNDPEAAHRMGIIVAREGSALGFNWVFSPVVDINYNFHSAITGTRSFGSDPEKVLAMARSYVKGVQENDMAACLKHWPGDGMDNRDQHMVTSCNSLDMESWWNSYGKIYKTLIDDGVKTVMSAHITLPAYYKERNPNIKPGEILPGSISPALNLELLRGELGFNGVIVSDATLMGGLTSVGPREDIVPMVIQNGCDIFLFSIDDDIDFALLLQAAKAGTITPTRLEEAVLRVLAFKASLKLHEKQATGTLVPSLEEAKKVVGCEEHKNWEQACIERSITLVKDTQNLLPLSPQNHKKVLLIESEPFSLFGPPIELNFKNYLEEAGFEVTRMAEDTVVESDLFDLVIYLLDQQEFFGRGNYRISWAEIHKGLFTSMNRYWHTIPTLMISLNNPYHLYDAPRVKTYINAYTSTDLVQRELVKMLLGEKPFKGVNPVDPFCEVIDSHL
jgi:beta-N-acetylhexosaminidase